MSKKSFILYQDYKKNLSVLTQAQKGDLLDAIFDFNEGKNSNLEGVVAMAFSFIKTDLEENAKKWEEAKREKSSSGRLGNMSRWNPKMYEQIKQGGISLEEAETIANDRKASQTIANDRKASQTIADDRKASQTIADDRKVSQCDKTQKIEKQFNEFWEAYNYKVDKKLALRAFKSALKKKSFETLLQKAQEYCKNQTINKIEKSYWKQPKTWLNSESWENNYDTLEEDDQKDYDENFEKNWLKCYSSKNLLKFNDFIQGCKKQIPPETFKSWFQFNFMGTGKGIEKNSLIFETEKEFIASALMGENNHCMNGNAKEIIFKEIKEHFGNKNLVFQYIKGNNLKKKEYKLN